MIAVGLFLSCAVATAPAVTGPLPELKAAIDELRRLPADDLYGGGMVPPAAIPLLKQMKHRLRDVVQGLLDSRGDAWTPDELRSAIESELRGAGIAIADEPPSEKDLGYGRVIEITVRRPEGHPNLLAVNTMLSLTCGDDSAFHLFRWDAGRWTRILTRESNGYRMIDRALGRFEYRISKPDAAGRFYVVTTSISPWCSSCWSALRYRVLAVSTDPDRPEVLGDGEHDIYACAGEELTLLPYGFRLGFQALPEKKTDYHWRTITYTVSRGGVKKLASKWGEEAK